MVGKKKANELGRSLIKNRFSNTQRKKNEENMLHVADLKDGYDWARLNLQSVTEEDSFQEFLRTAELAGTEFTAEKLNIQFVNPKSNVGLLSETERMNVEKLMKDNQSLLKIPRRPKWDKNTSPEELHANESRSFLEWRRDLAVLQEKEDLTMTPYEKNLEFWRQLWRVIEKSDVVVQIVDARSPLLYRSEDLEKYVHEVDPNKQNLLLLNKADYLTEAQRITWAKYFDEQELQVAFFSALEIENENEDDEAKADDTDNSSDSEDDAEDEERRLSLKEIKEKVNEISTGLDEIKEKLDSISPQEEAGTVVAESKEILKNNPNVLTRLELIEFFKTICRSHPSAAGKESVIIGLMGYPNVGKSSTINALLQEKKVSVSATPGKTKHFQTLYLEKDLILCDCCGLVLPSFCVTKAEMILNGILPIDQLRDHVPAINTLCTLIPRHVLEQAYGILIAKPMEGENPNRPPFSEELLLAYAYNRGFMTANGQPDQSRAARYVLKDFVNGKLLFCSAPPTVAQSEYHTYPDRTKNEPSLQNLPPRLQRSMKIASKCSSKDIDEEFFNTNNASAHVKGRNLMNFRVGAQSAESTSTLSSIGKPWKHQKKEKREKLRRKYAHLDQH